MERIVFCLMIVLLLFSCERKHNNKVVNSVNGNSNLNFEVVEIDGCEYLYRGTGEVLFTHKGNCKFCEEKKQTEKSE